MSPPTPKYATLFDLHDLVKRGNEDAAEQLHKEFSTGGSLAPLGVDTVRAVRYSELHQAFLELGDGLKLPNLDRAIPLPPVILPHWDGKRQSLIASVQIIIALPARPKQPILTGRAHIPEGHVLVFPTPARWNDGDVSWLLRPSQMVMQEGYWQARLAYGGGKKNLSTPLYFKYGEYLPTPQGWSEMDQDQRYTYFGWEYCGIAVPDTRPKHPLIAGGFARGVEVAHPLPNCKAGTVCPQSGVWVAMLPNDAPDAKSFNVWERQSYIEQGRTMPDADYWPSQNEGWNITTESIDWYLLEPWQGGSGAWIGEKPA